MKISVIVNAVFLKIQDRIWESLGGDPLQVPLWRQTMATLLVNVATQLSFVEVCLKTETVFFGVSAYKATIDHFQALCIADIKRSPFYPPSEKKAMSEFVLYIDGLSRDLRSLMNLDNLDAMKEAARTVAGKMLVKANELASEKK